MSISSLSNFSSNYDSSGHGSNVRVNGKIRAREVRVVGADGKQIGVLSLNDALAMARNLGVDLVEIAPNANPPVCKLIDYGKFRYEQAKKEKDAKKHQHASKMKEIQLSATIDQHDFKVKLQHAIDFLCDDMKVRVVLRFRGREMAHKEIGFGVVEKFINSLEPWGKADSKPALLGKGIMVTLTPLPKNKRAKNPREKEEENLPSTSSDSQQKPPEQNQEKKQPDNQSPQGFVNNPFAQINDNTDKQE
ncbi:MAG: translation initiation factor IF-3 [Limisphaerales bacterium]